MTDKTTTAPAVEPEETAAKATKAAAIKRTRVAKAAKPEAKKTADKAAKASTAAAKEAEKAKKLAERAEVQEKTLSKMEPLAKTINVRLEKAEMIEGKADDHRLAAALALKEAREMAEAAGIPFKKWCAEHIARWSYETVRKLVAVGKSDNPQQALEDMRKGNAERNRQHREQKRIENHTVKAKVSAGPLAALKAMPAEDGLKVVDKFVDEHGFKVVPEHDVKELAELRSTRKSTGYEAVKSGFNKLAPSEKVKFLRYAAESTGYRLVDDFADTTSPLAGKSEDEVGDELEADGRKMAELSQRARRRSSTAAVAGKA